MIENIRLSFRGIFAHKMRSFLTMLGIIIGIASIIAIVSTIKGTNDQIEKTLLILVFLMEFQLFQKKHLNP